MKRTFDIIFSLVGLLLCSPVMLISAVAVKLTSKGPVLFRQERIGLRFRPFVIFKFRTMVDKTGEQDSLICCGADPRVTGVGRILRTLKVDELPQLWNVLKGDMSFVGPRPEVRKYVELYPDVYAEILTVRPGITDTASIKYSNESEVLGLFENPTDAYIHFVLPDKLQLSRQYVQKSSFWLDLELILETILKITHLQAQQPSFRKPVTSVNPTASESNYVPDKLSYLAGRPISPSHAGLAPINDCDRPASTRAAG
jgi:lipopolysaccharide/colanic/teichoic acid biosynthesis glycosyltransferase